MNKIKFLLYLTMLVSGVKGRGQIYINSYAFGAAVSGDLLLNSFPNAAGAYSVRKLDKDYTGNCLIVRRKSDSALDTIPFSGNFVDTARIKTFCGTGATDTCWVTQIYDQSGNNRHVSQSTTTKQPAILRSGVLEKINGICSIFYDQVDDNLASSTFTAVSHPVTSFSLSRNLGDAASRSVHQLGTSSGFLFLQAVGSNISITSGTNLVSTVSTQLNTNYLIYALFNEANSAIQVNNVTQTTGSSGNELRTYNLMRIGRDVTNLSANANISELVVYHSNQSSNKDAIRANINNFYSIY